MLYLLLAIAFEVIATTALKACESFTKPIPSMIVVGGYAATLYLFSKALVQMNVGVAYAIWAGLGIVLVTITSAIMFRQTLDSWGFGGIVLILTGVAVLSFLSRSTTHG